jgi:hypothetical protein
MRKWFKRCEHDFQKIGETTDFYVDDYGRGIHYLRYRLYCPKCNKEKLVDAERYEIEKTKDKVWREYHGK